MTKPAGGEFPQGTFGLAMDGNGIDNIDRNLQVWMTSNGGETYDVAKMRYTLDDPKTIEAYEFLVKLVNDHKVMVTPEQWGPLAQQAPSSEPFINGIIGFRQESTGRLTLYAQNIGSQVRVGRGALPHRDEGAALHRPLGRGRDPGLRQGQERGRGLQRRQVHRGRRDAEDHGREQAADPGPAQGRRGSGHLPQGPAEAHAAFVEPLKTGLFRTSFYHWNGLRGPDACRRSR